MAKKSLIQREHKRKKLEEKYRLIRQSLKKERKALYLNTKSKASYVSTNKIKEMQRKLQSLPRNSAPIRLHRRCLFTGRPRANYRDFGLSGHILREMIHACLLPGATKSSW